MCVQNMSKKSTLLLCAVTSTCGVDEGRDGQLDIQGQCNLPHIRPTSTYHNHEWSRLQFQLKIISTFTCILKQNRFSY